MKVRIEQRPGRAFTLNSSSAWPTATPEAAGLDRALLESAANVAKSNSSDCLLVVRGGKLIMARYWNAKAENDVQQTFSGTKSVFSLLLGRSIARGYVDGLEQPIRELVSEMPEAHSQLTFRNILAMESGMENSMEIEGLGAEGRTQLEIALERKITAAPFERYHYNNAPYRLLFTALERASGMGLEELTAQEVFGPLGFDGAYWMRIFALAGSTDVDSKLMGYQSIRMRPVDFAKSSQVIIDEGMWQGERYLPAEFTRELIRCPAPAANPSFGLFHHLNAGDHYRNFAAPDRIDRKLLPGAPNDAFLMFGAGGQVTAGIASLGLVVVRTGSGTGSIYERDNYIAQLLALVTEAAQ